VIVPARVHTTGRPPYDVAIASASPPADAAGPALYEPSGELRAAGTDHEHGSRAELRQRLDRLPAGHPSSPYAEDGRRRADAVRLRDLELPAEEPGSGAAPDGEARTWAEALPGLRARWEDHLRRWPPAEVKPADRAGDEPGSWRGEAGQYLNAEENLVAGHALDRVREAEPAVTRALRAVEAAVPGSRLVGLEHRLKGEDRYKEKVAAELYAKPDRPLTDIADGVPDSLRYTFTLNPGTYTADYRRSAGILNEMGYELKLVRNYWQNDQYKGINTRWIATGEQPVEIQFHTEGSFAAKQFTHAAYERLRNPVASDEERQDLYEFQAEASDVLQVPENAGRVTDYRKGSQE
jgi:hypothetical protein